MWARHPCAFVIVGSCVSPNLLRRLPRVQAKQLIFSRLIANPVLRGELHALRFSSRRSVVRLLAWVPRRFFSPIDPLLLLSWFVRIAEPAIDGNHRPERLAAVYALLVPSRSSRPAKTKPRRRVLIGIDFYAPPIPIASSMISQAQVEFRAVRRGQRRLCNAVACTVPFLDRDSGGAPFT